MVFWIIVFVVAVGVFLFFVWNRKWQMSLSKFLESLEAGDLEKARKHLEKAMEAVSNRSLHDPRKLIVDLEVARMHSHCGRLDEAVSIIDSVLDQCDPVKLIYRNIYSRALLNLAEANGAQGEARRAEKNYKKAIEYREANFGAESFDVAIALNRYADFLTELQRFSEAEEVLKRAELIRLQQH